jgi:hypothetical protein
LVTVYDTLLRWHTQNVTPILHQVTLDDAKDRLQEATGLHPTNERLLKSFKALGVLLHLRDHMRSMLIGRIKCGPYWRNIPGYEDRAHCSFCKKKDSIETLEDEQHMWLDCQNNGQTLAWNTAKRIWGKTTSRDWPNITTGLIRGAAACDEYHIFPNPTNLLQHISANPDSSDIPAMLSS